VQTKQVYQTPHLTTATTESLNILERQLLSQEKKIEEWFESQWKISPAPVYGSVDLRNAGFKLAPVDMNLFPAGFNNLNAEFMPISVEASAHAIHQFYPGAKKLLLLPESHTRNLFYWENIKTLLDILSKAEFDVRVGSLLPDVSDVVLNSGEKIKVQSLTRKENRIGIDDFDPDLILLNNDLSDGIPEILHHLDQQLIPPAELGWSQRLKSGHFQYYKEVTHEFAKMVDIDPWFIDPLFKHCGEVDFMNREGENCLSTYVAELLESIQKKYDEYKIDCKPFVIVKADAGTYGMAVMTVRDAKELESLNRKQRTHMAKSKGGQPVQRVIIQEGVYTFETWGDKNSVAEPVVYMWGERVVGGFYRVHKERGIDENLNAPGMHFEPLAFVKTCHEPLTDASPDECQNRFYVYGVIARLSMLAAAREMLEQVNKDTVSG
jgi:glutamate--cysteine ligase